MNGITKRSGFTSQIIKESIGKKSIVYSQDEFEKRCQDSINTGRENPPELAAQLPSDKSSFIASRNFSSLNKVVHFL
jgi:hypothetical protein